jgi:hypothetical protein
MPISITCTGCGKRLKARDSLAGRTVPCPGCGTKLTIGSVEDAAAAMLLDDQAPEAAEPKLPPSDQIPPTLERGEQRQSEPVAKPARPRKKAATAPEVTSLPPLTTNDPSPWLRHLHWLLVLSLIPLALSLLLKDDERDFLDRLIKTIEQAPESSRWRIEQALQKLEDGKGSLEDLFSALPDEKLSGALFPRHTWKHWLFTAGATLLFLTFLLVLSLEGSATPGELLAVGTFTATIGIVFLLIVQALAAWSQGMIIIRAASSASSSGSCKRLGYRTGWRSTRITGSFSASWATRPASACARRFAKRFP